VEPLWRSSDLPALRRLLFAQYFRPEEAQAAAEAPESFGVSGPELTAGIEGFGAFRPALFADPGAQQQRGLLEGAGGSSSAQAGAQQLTPTPQQSLPDGLRRERDGTVWAEFVLPPPLTIEQRRERERERKLGKGAKPMPTPLPTLPQALLKVGK